MKQALDTRTKLLTKSPWPLMLELSIPAVLGMVVVGLYNMMESWVIGWCRSLRRLVWASGRLRLR